MESNYKIVFRILFHLLLIYIALFLLISFVSSEAKQIRPVNQDTSAAFLFANDFIEDPSVVYDWNHGSAFYIIPDWFLVLIVVALPLSLKWMPLFYWALLASLYSVSGGALIAKIAQVRILTGIWSLVLAFIAFGWMVLIIEQYSPPISVWANSYSSAIYLMLGAPFYHTGAVLMTLVSMFVLIRYFECRDNKKAITLGILTFLTSLSDLIFVAWFVIPSVLVLTLRYWVHKEKNNFVISGVLVIASGLGWVSAEALGSGVNDAPTGLVGFFGALGNLSSYLSGSIRDGDFVFVLIAAAAAVLIHVSGRRTMEMLRQRYPSSIEGTSEVLFGIASGGGIVAPLVTGVMIGGAPRLRYVLIAVVIVIVWLTWRVLKSDMGRYLREYPGVMIAGVALSLVVTVRPGLSGAKDVVEPKAVQECLESEGLTAGIGSHWWAKVYMLKSEGELHIVPVRRYLEPVDNTYNRKWFTKHMEDGRPLTLEFVLLEAGLNREMVRERYGSPAERMECGGKEIWRYDRPLEAPRLGNY